MKARKKKNQQVRLAKKENVGPSRPGLTTSDGCEVRQGKIKEKGTLPEELADLFTLCQSRTER